MTGPVHHRSYGFSGPVREPILQIHPSLRCNLSCRHCYSSSGPLVRLELDVTTVCSAVSDAAEMGYKVVSISGGEPFMYAGLTQVLSHAKSLGMRTTVTTNGYFLQLGRLIAVRDFLDVLAISLDGPPELHNHMRGSPRAFERLATGLPALRDADLRFGFIHTLTQNTWEHLLWVADFAAANGASLLQIHPLELSGRAQDQMRSDAPEEDVLAKAYLLTFAIACKYPDMGLQCDLLHRNDVLDDPQLIYASELDKAALRSTKAADLLGLIVVEANGIVVPISYGFSRDYQLCNLHEQRLREAWPEYLESRYLTFRQLCRQLFEDLIGLSDSGLFNWYELIVAYGRRVGPSVLARRKLAAV